MNSLPERVRQLITNLKQFSARRAFREGLGYCRTTGDRLTGGGLRSMVKRVVTKSLRSAAGQPFLRTLGHGVLRPFPSLSAHLYRLATVADTAATPAEPADSEETLKSAEVPAALANSEEALKSVNSFSQKEETAYSLWVAKYDTISDADRGMIRGHISTLPFRPLISVTIAVDTTSAVGLDKSFESVVSQLYPYWELCIAVDYLTEPLVKPFLLSARTLDPRIKLVRSGSVGGSESTNAALNATTGEFVTFLQPGDVLAEHALYEVVITLGGNRQADVVYTDSDRLDSDGKRTDPWFKPGWDPDLLLGQDYLSAFAVYRRELARDPQPLSRCEGN